jgi:hypothetical protein
MTMAEESRNPAPAPGPATPPSQPTVPPPQPAAPVSAAAKPSQIQTLGILVLISGIINCLAGLGLLFTVIWILPAAFGIVVGILEILYATKLMADPIKVNKPAKHIAIMEIVAIINGSLFSVVVGILALVWYNEPKIKEYFDSQPSV